MNSKRITKCALISLQEFPRIQNTTYTYTKLCRFSERPRKSKENKSSYELEMINKNSNRLLRLIDNLLDFRKVENKTFNLRVSKTNIYDFSYALYRDFENEAKKRISNSKLFAITKI
jgi:K+-sensing histidine kinase KdpD